LGSFHLSARLDVLLTSQPDKEPEMNVTRIGLDLAKHVFQGLGIDQQGRPAASLSRHGRAGWGGVNPSFQK